MKGRVFFDTNILEAIELCLETKDQEGWALPENYEVVDINIVAA